jgi:hypothetical protein
MSDGVKDQKSTETSSTPQRASSQTQMPKEKLFQALRNLEKVPTPLNEAVED